MLAAQQPTAQAPPKSAIPGIEWSSPDKAPASSGRASWAKIKKQIQVAAIAVTEAAMTGLNRRSGLSDRLRLGRGIAGEGLELNQDGAGWSGSNPRVSGPDQAGRAPAD